MTETPKAPFNPFDLLITLAGTTPQASGAGRSNSVPVFNFDNLFESPRSAGASKHSGVEDVLGLFQDLARGIVPETDVKTEKPAPRFDPRPTAYSDVSIQIPLVGVPKENISIEVQGEFIVVKATVPAYVDVPEGKREIHKQERLPLNVDLEKITSTHKDGLLTINLPAIKPTKVKIDVSEG